MNWLIALLFGILIGWLIEWVIDWYYWRQRGSQFKIDLASANEEIASLKAQLKKEGLLVIDRLQEISGIGPVIESKLNDAGIYTFDDLAKLNQKRLQEMVGADIRNLADEKEIIRQAREFLRRRT